MAANRNVEVTVKLVMNERTAKLFLGSSVERVINTSLNIVHTSEHPDFFVNEEDWDEWKPVVVAITNGVRDQLFRQRSNMADENVYYSVNKGEIGG